VARPLAKFYSTDRAKKCVYGCSAYYITALQRVMFNSISNVKLFVNEHTWRRAPTRAAFLCIRRCMELNGRRSAAADARGYPVFRRAPRPARDGSAADGALGQKGAGRSVGAVAVRRSTRVKHYNDDRGSSRVLGRPRLARETLFFVPDAASLRPVDRVKYNVSLQARDHRVLGRQGPVLRWQAGPADMEGQYGRNVQLDYV